MSVLVVCPQDVLKLGSLEPLRPSSSPAEAEVRLIEPAEASSLLPRSKAWQRGRRSVRLEFVLKIVQDCPVDLAASVQPEVEGA